jgi:hypothetical protein
MCAYWKQLEIDGLAHGAIADIVGMKVITAVVTRRDGRTAWIGNNAIEANDCISATSTSR